MLVRFTTELKRRNDIVDDYQNMPWCVEESTDLPMQKKPCKIDLNKGLNTLDLENLEFMALDPPQIVYKRGAIGKTLEKIETLTRQHGQQLSSKTPARKKTTAREKEIVQKQRQTFEKKVCLKESLSIRKA